MIAVGNKNAFTVHANNDLLFNNYARANTLSAYYGAKVQLEAGHDITFNHTYSDTSAVQGLPILYFGNNADATITAGNDINFNRNQYAYLIGVQYNGKAVVTAKGNINFREQEAGYMPVVSVERGGNLEMQAQAITGNTQQIVSTTYGSQALLKANEINWIAEGRDMSDYAEKNPHKTSMLVAYRGNSKVELQADKAINLSIGVPHTMLYASGGNIALNAGESIYLHSAGKTDDVWQSNLRAENGTIDLTSGGTIAIENEGATAAYSDYSGNINFNGSTLINGAGVGAKSVSSGKINFNGNTLISKSGIGAWAESDIDPWAEELSTITFNDDVEIARAETGAGAKYNSDIIFNKGLYIEASENAFYAESAGRIKALMSGTDKIIKGNMQALNGQIDVLLDTESSSFTGAAELQNIEKVFAFDDEEEDDGDDWETPVIDETPVINITLQNGAVWNVTGDSSLTNLVNDSYVNMSDENHTGTAITAKNLSGTGTMVMDLDWTGNGGVKEKTDNSDYITVTESATGTQAIVSDPSTMHLDKMGVDDRLYFATLTDSDAVFTSSITQRNVQKGSLYDYIIGIDSETTDSTTDWFFGTVDHKESPLIPGVRKNSQIMYDLVTDMDTLNKRMGDVRYITTDPDGLWARTTYTHNDHDSYSGHSNRFEVGKDYVTSRDDGSTVHKGVSFTYLHSNASFTEGNGKYDRYTGSLYYTWLGNNGPYVDVVGRIGKLNGDNRIFLVNGDESESSFGTWYQQGSVEAGRNYDLKDGWYIEPQAQLQYTHMNSKNYTGNDGIGYRSDGVNSLIGRVGFRLGNHIDANRSWYVKGDILHEFSGDGGVIFTSANGLERIEYTRDGKDTWYDIGAGLNAELSHDRSLWFEFERKFSGSYKNSWEFNAGMSWKF